MPRYFFNVHDGHSEHDTEGTELTGVDAARVLAVQLAGEVLRDDAHRQSRGETWCLEVLSEAGGIVCSVNVSVSVPSPNG